MPEAATHKGRGAWRRWSGSPGLLARIAREAESQVLANDSGPGELRIRVVAAAWESEFIDAGHFENGLAEADIPDVESVEIYSYVAGRNITVLLARPPKSQRQNQTKPDVVTLNVAGPERSWVRDATEAMTQAIKPGVPQSERFFRGIYSVSVPVMVIGFILIIIAGSADLGGFVEGVGWTVLITGLGLLVIGVLPESLLPGLEVLPEGKQSWRSRALRRGRREVGWWTRNIFLVLIGIGLTLLVQRLK
jgi:hypothetical protein